jgi:hypothetical protein
VAGVQKRAGHHPQLAHLPRRRQPPPAYRRSPGKSHHLN